MQSTHGYGFTELLSLSILTELWYWHNDLHFTDEETEIWWSWITCPCVHSWKAIENGLIPYLWCHQVCAFQCCTLLLLCRKGVLMNCLEWKHWENERLLGEGEVVGTLERGPWSPVKEWMHIFKGGGRNQRLR